MPNRVLWLALSLSACAESSPPPTAAPVGAEVGDASLDARTAFDASAPRADAVSSMRDADDCVRGQYTAMARPLDMFILLDQSGSMQEDEDRWTPTTNALKSFVGGNVARTSVSMQYFPLGESDEDKCEAQRYAAPDVPMAELPGNAVPVRTSIDAHYFTHEECCDTDEHSGTPTRPAVEGAAAYMRDWLAQHPDHVGVILLATDGEPSGVCDDNSVDDVAKAIADAAGGTPAVKTYVVGIGDNDALDQLAEAGATGEGALIVDGSGAMTEQQFLDAVSRIREAALPCDYAINAADPTQLNVEWSAGAGAVQLINVGDATNCAKASDKGWYYDDPTRPTRVNLCPDACKQLGQTAGATVRIVEGCQTVLL